MVHRTRSDLTLHKHNTDVAVPPAEDCIDEESEEEECNNNKKTHENRVNSTYQIRISYVHHVKRTWGSRKGSAHITGKQRIGE